MKRLEVFNGQGLEFFHDDEWRSEAAHMAVALGTFDYFSRCEH